MKDVITSILADVSSRGTETIEHSLQSQSIAAPWQNS
jgi:hypothetical protein